MESNEKKENIVETRGTDSKPECFVIMPISDQEGYEVGHFTDVYNDIFIPAIEKAGFKPYRADDSKSSSVIHTTIIRRLLDAPMAICDLSSKNPNVLYELGIRQAFDKPVLLVGDDDPSKIFDISNINTHIYKKRLNYREVINDQEKICEMLKGTYDNSGKEYNSLLSVLKINSALENYNDKNDFKENDILKIMYQEIMSLKDDIREINQKMKTNNENPIEINNFDQRKNEWSEYNWQNIYNTLVIKVNNLLNIERFNMKTEIYIQNIDELVSKIDMIIKISGLSKIKLNELISLRNRLDNEKQRALGDIL